MSVSEALEVRFWKSVEGESTPHPGTMDNPEVISKGPWRRASRMDFLEFRVSDSEHNALAAAPKTFIRNGDYRDGKFSESCGKDKRQ